MLTHYIAAFLFLAVSLCPGNSYAVAVNDLKLLGEGEAYYLKFIKVYDASLYADRTAEQENILSTGVSKCLLLKYAVPVSRKDFVKAANTILSRQFTAGELAQVQGEIERIHSGYTDVNANDTYSLCYNGNEAVTTLHHNDREVVRIPSRDFARVYFSIWLSDVAPLDRKLRDNLLAKAPVR